MECVECLRMIARRLRGESSGVLESVLTDRDYDHDGDHDHDHGHERVRRDDVRLYCRRLTPVRIALFLQ